jgi:hypothetical protein
MKSKIGFVPPFRHPEAHTSALPFPQAAYPGACAPVSDPEVA